MDNRTLSQHESMTAIALIYPSVLPFLHAQETTPPPAPSEPFEVKFEDDAKLSFVLAGGPRGDPGLTFIRKP
jgi:hypothetical protein